MKTSGACRSSSVVALSFCPLDWHAIRARCGAAAPLGRTDPGAVEVALPPTGLTPPPVRSVFLRDGVKAPLALGDVLLADGSLVKGFVGESYGVVGAPDISSHSGWRSFLASSSA